MLKWWNNLALVNIGIRVINVSNVIVRGLKIQKVLASTDAIGKFLKFLWLFAGLIQFHFQ